MHPEVKPRMVSRASFLKPRSAFEGVEAGCGVAVLVYFAIFALAEFMPADSPLNRIPGGVVSAIVVMVGLPALFGVLASEYSKHRQAQDWQRGEFRKHKNEALQEAKATTEKLYELQARAKDLAKELPPLIRRAEGELDEAEREFRERAYSPFWDHITKAAEHLAIYQLVMDQIAGISGTYRALLEGRSHSFPEKLDVPLEIIAPDMTLRRLHGVTRLGLTDFEFAQIWEHHKSRRVMVEGFSTLESAIHNLEGALENSIENCTVTISMVLVELLLHEDE